MKVVAIIFCTLLSFSNTIKYLPLNNLQVLISKLMFNELSENETVTLQDALEILRRPYNTDITPRETSSPLRMTIDCIMCKSAASAFAVAVKLGKPDEEIIEVFTKFCTFFGITSALVCRGVLTFNIPILSYIAKTTPEVRPGTFCGLILQSDTNPNVCPYTDPRFEWHVDLPEKRETKSKRYIKNDFNIKPFKIAVLSDAHIDPLYEPYGVADCNEPRCCRKGQSRKSPAPSTRTINETNIEESVFLMNGQLLLNLSAHLNVHREAMERIHEFPEKSELAGFWGDYRNCDTPTWTFEDVINNIKEKHNDIDALYYLGDTIDHGIWETSYAHVNKMSQYLIDTIRNTFGEHVLVVPVIGNHDSQPVNQFAPSSIENSKLNTTWLYNALAAKWKPYLTDEAVESLRAHGDYSLLVRPGFRIISLNNIVAYRYNWWVLYDPFYPKKHLDWLIEELDKAELAGEKVHILAHIPPGTVDLIYTWTREYNRIINRFSSTIAAEFNGHTHTDEFKIYYNPEKIPINVAWGAGAISFYSFYNLNYKIVEFDTNTLLPINMYNYIFNLTEANLRPNQRPDWFQLYDLKGTFGLADLTPMSMDTLLYSMVTEQRSLMQLYVAYTMKMSDVLVPKCDDSCRVNTLCDSVITVLWERQKCEELKKLFYIIKK